MRVLTVLHSGRCESFTPIKIMPGNNLAITVSRSPS